MAMMVAASSNLTFAHTHCQIHHTYAPLPPPGVPFIRRRSTGYRWLWEPSLHLALLLLQLLVDEEECPCPSHPSPPLLLHCLHFLLLSLPSATEPLLHLSHCFFPRVESGVADDLEAGEEDEEDYGVCCWSSLYAEERQEKEETRRGGRGKRK